MFALDGLQIALVECDVQYCRGAYRNVPGGMKSEVLMIYLE